MESKICSKCSKTKSVTEFYKSSRNKDGYHYSCKVCDRKYSKKINNPVSVSEKKCRKCNKTKSAEEFSKHSKVKDGLKNKCKSCVREYNKKNSEYIRKRNLEYFHKIDKHKRKFREKIRRKEDPIFRLKNNIRSRTAMAIREKGYTKKSKTQEILGCDWLKLKEHLENQFREGMTWDNYGKWHVDHIIPYACATTEEQVLKVSKYTNLQPLWEEENLIKGGITHHIWKV